LPGNQKAGNILPGPTNSFRTRNLLTIILFVAFSLT